MITQFRTVAGGVIVALIIAAAACAQPMMPAPAASDPGHKPATECTKCDAERHHGGMMLSNFFCPELVMRYQKDLDLTADQQKTIKSEMVDLAGRMTDLRWQMSDERGKLADLMKEAKPDERAILSQAEKVMRIENDLKLSTLTALIRIKNALTPEQQEKMGKLQEHLEHHHPWRPHMMEHHMMEHHWDGPMMRPGPMGFFGGPPPVNPQ